MHSNAKLLRVLFFAILILGFFLRLYRFDSPIADWHSWRQADTSSVSRNFVKEGFDVLRPTYHDLSNVPSGKDNPKGFRFVEFPLYNIAQGGLFVAFGILSLEQWGRLVTIISSLLATTFLYLIIKKNIDEMTALFSAFFYTFLPFSIYYGRSILPDTSMVMAILGGIYFFDRWLSRKTVKDKKTHKNNDQKNYMFSILSVIFTAAALLLKPFAIFFTLPMLYLAWQKFGFSIFKKWQLWLFAILVISPVGLWRTWITQFPEGIPANTWLFNGNGIRFRPSFFRWMLYERLIKLISGYVGTLILVAGVLQLLAIKNAGLVYSFILSSVLYIVVVATGNVQHDYYQILILPSIALIYGLGATYLFSHQKKVFTLPLGKALLVVLTILTMYFSWDQIKDYFNINNREMIEAGRSVDALTPKDAKVIALYDGDTSFLYQTNRNGWTSYQDPLPVMIEKGADYLVQLNPSEFDRKSFAKQYKVVKATPTYIIVQLQ